VNVIEKLFLKCLSKHKQLGLKSHSSMVAMNLIFSDW